MAFDRIRQQLAHQQASDGYRQTRSVSGGNQPKLTYLNKRYLNFSSNDYLGLATDDAVKQAAIAAVNEHGAGCGGSPLVTGHGALHQYLQDQLKDLTGQSGVMLYTSGFAANSGVIATLLSKDDFLLQDKLNHASLMTAGRDSAVKMKRFAHNDIANLDDLLSSKPVVAAAERLVITEGVFSMDGDSAPLQQISTLCQANKSWLMVDDAHGFGINGQGAGSCHQAGIKPDILMATFGKAIGTSGAFVAADQDVIEYLVNFCRHYIYSTSLSPMVVGATIASIKLAQQPWRHQKLEQLIGHFKGQAKRYGLNVMTSDSAIQPVIIGDSHQALMVVELLRQQGIWLTAIRPPTVAQGSARLRITLSANHTTDDIDRLVTTLSDALLNLEAQ